MAPMKRKYRTIYLVTAALMVAMIGGYALAATSLTPGPNQGTNVITSPTSGFGLVSISSEQLVILTTPMSTATVAGNQTGTVALYGTTWRLAICAAAPCVPQNFRPVSPATPVVGDYAEQFVLSVTQPTPASGQAAGFDFSITIVYELNGVPPTSTAVFQGYLATGASAAAPTIPVFLFMDLGTTTPLTITTISTIINQCSSTTNCP
ncbi:MAG TPA: hypothetical protein VEH28_03580 [Thermoplasmata archaeon]|nr:hypothetical protein [Thermoplasmata archaeon]